MGQTRSWAVTTMKLMLIGDAPRTPVATWEELAEQVGWVAGDDRSNTLRLETVNEYHSDLTKLMGWSWTKLAAVLTVLGLVFAFGRDSLNETRELSAVLAVAATIVATSTALWAISPRGKVWRRATDSGLVALSVNTLEKQCWDKYRWLWHRQRTWRGIERGLWITCLLGILVLGTFMWNLVPWSVAYDTIYGWFGA